MYDELIKRLRASVDGRYEKCDGCPYEEDYPCCVDCLDKMHKQAADAIEKLSKEVDKWKATEQEERDAYWHWFDQYQKDVSRWIPVTEALPSYGDWVLGIGPKKGYYVCEYRGITHWSSEGYDPWFSAKGSSVTITHWMPLPQPPIGGIKDYGWTGEPGERGVKEET